MKQFILGRGVLQVGCSSTTSSTARLGDMCAQLAAHSCHCGQTTDGLVG